MYVDGSNQWRWRLLTGDNRTIANSAEGYWNEAECVAAIDLVKGSSTAAVYKP